MKAAEEILSFGCSSPHSHLSSPALWFYKWSADEFCMPRLGNNFRYKYLSRKLCIWELWQMHRDQKREWESLKNDSFSKKKYLWNCWHTERHTHISLIWCSRIWSFRENPVHLQCSTKQFCRWVPMGQVRQPFALCPWAVVSLTLGSSSRREGKEYVRMPTVGCLWGVLPFLPAMLWG